MSDFLIKLEKAAGGAGNVRTGEPMKNHTTFRTGGPAAYFAAPSCVRELSDTVKFCREEGMPHYILGNGSNLLVGDRGYSGVVISMEKFCECTVTGDRIRAGAGIVLARIARKALEASLTGFEFAAGIPGTFGGAVVMNAGAYGGEMKQILQSVTVVDGAGKIENLDAEDLDLGYRHSNILQRDYIVAGGEIRLKPGDQALIKARMEELAAKRREKQPLEYPSAGSTFKRPEGYFAGKLIQDAGLRGFQVGGAQVSEKHCGFVINRCHATSADILELCRQIQQRVKQQSGVDLEMEVRCLGDF